MADWGGVAGRCVPFVPWCPPPAAASVATVPPACDGAASDTICPLDRASSCKGAPHAPGPEPLLRWAEEPPDRRRHLTPRSRILAERSRVEGRLDCHGPVDGAHWEQGGLWVQRGATCGEVNALDQNKTVTDVWV